MKLLLAVDGSNCAWHALAEVLRLFRLQETEIHLIAVAPPAPFITSAAEYIVTEMAEQRRMEARNHLDSAAKALEAAGLKAYKVFREGDPAAEILDYATAAHPDLVILGSHGAGALGRLVLGSVSEAVAHRWTGALMIVRPAPAQIPMTQREREVRTVMTREPVVAHATQSINEVAELMKNNDTGFLPVMDDHRIIGVVTDRDLATRVVADRRDPHLTTVAEVCTREPAWVTPAMPVTEAVELMIRRRIRRLVVMDGRKLVGVVTLGDLAETEPGAADVALVEISRSAKTLGHQQI